MSTQDDAQQGRPLPSEGDLGKTLLEMISKEPMSIVGCVFGDPTNPDPTMRQYQVTDVVIVEGILSAYLKYDQQRFKYIVPLSECSHHFFLRHEKIPEDASEGTLSGMTPEDIYSGWNMGVAAGWLPDLDGEPDASSDRESLDNNLD